MGGDGHRSGDDRLSVKFHRYANPSQVQTDRQTDRQKAMHMSPLRNMHRWAQ